MKRILLVSYSFVLMNCAAIAGLYHFARHGRNPWNNVWVKPPSSRVGASMRLVWR